MSKRPENTVKRRIKNLLNGAGSILVIAPHSANVDFREHLPSESVADALGSDWAAVGDDLAFAMAEAERKSEWDEPAERSVSDG